MEKIKKYWFSNIFLLDLVKALILLILLPSFFAYAQTCEGDISLDNQAAVNSFSGCSIIEGDLFLGSDAITDLSPLSSLEKITGDLTLQSLYELSTLNGLQSLKSVEGEIFIVNADKLENLDGLNNLNYAGKIRLSANDLLSNIKALANLTELDPDEGIFSLEGSPKMESLTGLEGITKLKGGLSLSYAPLITHLSPLSNLVELGSLRLHDLDGLKDLNGFGALQSIKGDIEIQSNNSLIDLNGFSSLQSIEGDFRISNNNSLLSLSGLKNVSISTSYIWIAGNYNLCNCSIVPDICDLITDDEIYVQITGNAKGCESIDEVIEICQSGNYQICYGPVTLSTQSEVDNFVNNYPGVTEFISDITIIGNEIHDLSGLNVLQSIAGCLTISNTALLKNLSGLENLSSLYCLKITGNTDLSSLEGLSSLSMVENIMVIDGNDKLISLEGLGSLAHIEELTISNNQLLIDLSGLDALQTIGSESGQDAFQLIGNPSLKSLNGLQKLEKIEGSFIIRNNNKIESLIGLGNIKSLNYALHIQGNPALIDLNGLSQLESVGSYWEGETAALIIEDNDKLISLEYLEALTNVKGIIVSNNELLKDLAGLEALKSFGLTTHQETSIHVIGNPSLLSMNGMQGVEKVEGVFIIKNNAKLESLVGLDNLESIGRGFHILENPNLENLNGLDQLEKIGTPDNQLTITNGLVIENNDKLTSLEGLESLIHVEGLTISDNELLSDLSGLETLQTIGNGITPWYLGYDRNGMLVINNPSLLSLNGIQGVEEINGGLFIQDNLRLESLVGLDNINALGAGLHILNNSTLENLEELSQLQTIGGSYAGLDANDQAVYISIEINNNEALKNLEGLSNLKNNSRLSGGGVRIRENPSLTSLMGLDNYNFRGVRYNYLQIIDNPELAHCSIPNVCELTSESWFAYPPSVDIRNNSNGCNSPGEVKIRCSPTGLESSGSNDMVVFPNPSTQTFTISTGNTTIMGLEIYNVNGIKVLSLEEKSSQEYDISSLRPGVYMLRIKTTSGIVKRNIIKN